MIDIQSSRRSGAWPEEVEAEYRQFVDEVK